jgi:MoaA/NifB/PqqE/SkfB family radical SAM enzyme
MAVRQVCLYLTRRCNIACQYCNVIKYRKPELDTPQFKAVIDLVTDVIKPELLVFFGGEPLLRKDMQELVDYTNGKVPYTIISNSILPYNLERVESLTASIDAVEVFGTTGDCLKTTAGLTRLLLARERGVPNLAGNMIAHSGNYKQIPALIRLLTSERIHSIVGVVHCGEGDWKFRSTDENINLTKSEAIWLARELVEMKDSGNYLIHNSREYLLMMAQHGASLDWHCSKPNYLTIDCDGGLIACNDWWGHKTRTIWDWDKAEWEKEWWENTKDCPGCFYNHQVQVESTANIVTKDIK